MPNPLHRKFELVKCVCSRPDLPLGLLAARRSRIVDAVRASISIPGIVKPFYHKGRHLIDGGVTNPLPISLLVNEGVRKIIAAYGKATKE